MPARRAAGGGVEDVRARACSQRRLRAGAGRSGAGCRRSRRARPRRRSAAAARARPGSPRRRGRPPGSGRPGRTAPRTPRCRPRAARRCRRRSGRRRTAPRCDWAPPRSPIRGWPDSAWSSSSSVSSRAAASAAAMSASRSSYGWPASTSSAQRGTDRQPSRHLARDLDGHQQNPGTCSHASPAGGASSRRHLRLDQAVGPVGGDEHLAVVGQPVDVEAARSRRGSGACWAPRTGSRRSPAGCRAPREPISVQRLLERAGVGRGEGREQAVADLGVRRVPVDVGARRAATSRPATWPGSGRRSRAGS